MSLPEVPLLGVLPGTGGLTRVVDKRKVRRDLADMFCTNPDGVKGERAKEWGLVDDIAVPAKFQELVRTRAEALGERLNPSADCEGHQADSAATARSTTTAITTSTLTSRLIAPRERRR